VASPLPTAGLAGQPVAVYPLTVLSADESLGWQTALGTHRSALDRADSILGASLVERSPEVKWIPPSTLRRQARQAPGMLPNPDQLATRMLAAPNMKTIPDPLRSQLRALTGVTGQRYALVPTTLVFLRDSVQTDSVRRGRAELGLVMVDVRTGLVGWRTKASGTGTDPWAALRVAVNSLVPGLP
jgi:hypothetical protein